MKKITYITLVFLLIGIFFMFNKNNNNITLDEVKIKDNKSNVTFAMYKENNEGEYELITNTEEFPQVPYILDEDKSKCINSDGNIIDNSLKQTIEDNKIFVETDEEAYCYLYFKMGTFEYLFDYTGSEQEFTVPYTGTYKIELWGGGSIAHGRGAYVSGTGDFNKNTNLYLYIGQNGYSYGNFGYSYNRTCTGYCYGTPFNGGGRGAGANGYSGGGATDIRLVNGSWNDSSGLRSRIIVAAGAGSLSSGNGGPGESIAAGGLIGYNGTRNRCDNGTASYCQFGYGATQTAAGSSYRAGSFGIGGDGGAGGYNNSSYPYPWNGGGGGSGYYGGAGGNGDTCCGSGGSGGGGSSFISGHNGCVAIESSASLTPRLDSSGNRCANGTTDIECSKHYSGYIFTDTVMIDGAGYQWTTVKGSQVQMPKPDGTLYPLGQGHTGNGYAKITYLGT